MTGGAGGATLGRGEAGEGPGEGGGEALAGVTVAGWVWYRDWSLKLVIEGGRDSDEQRGGGRGGGLIWHL